MGDVMDIRQITEEFEKVYLSPFAAKSISSKGRVRLEEECQVRTVYQRDRDRIIHSKSFRRLKDKTQVFIAPQGDHYRTRLTHTLEVAQIARTIAKALTLNEDLTEAIALGHDLGHTPFGHAGEEALNAVFSTGFKHNEQSLRVVETIEAGKGLNLAWEVRDGILNHTGPDKPGTLEGQIVKIADRIAYINHDIDDALRGGIITLEEIPRVCLDVLGLKHGDRINVMVVDMIKASWGQTEIKMSDSVSSAMGVLRNFLFERVYVGSEAKKEEFKAKQVVTSLYNYFIKDQDSLPTEHRIKLAQSELAQIVCDYVAGMTDRYALQTYQRLFLPKPWL